MNLIQILATLRSAPGSLLEAAHPLMLGAFLNGYGLGNQSAGDVLRAVNDDFPGASVASACAKAYLLFDEDIAFSRILDALDVRIGGIKEWEPATSAFTPEGFISTVIGAIRAGRPGMMLGELTLSWFANAYAGFLAGYEEVDPRQTADARNDLAMFSKWVGERFTEPSAGWYKVLRVYHGPGETGLRKFADLWDEYHAR